MSDSVNTLEPKIVWKYFDRIRKIPHGSKNEKALGKALMAWSKESGCEAEIDDVGNVLIQIPASPGREKAPTVILQGHQDMVCEKNTDTAFDFEKDAIALVRDGDWIQAQGTTLGADNGIGMSVALSFMEMKDTPHGPLELLFTVDEETGLKGARGLAPDFVKGRMLFNLDSEEDGVFYVGCAGGRDSHMELELTHVPAPKGHKCFKFEVKGLRGGHSGLDIVQNRGNAIRLLARALIAISKEVGLWLVSIDGGDKHNAIPREAAAFAYLEPGRDEIIERIVKAQAEAFMEEFKTSDPKLALTMELVSSRPKALEQSTCSRMLNLLASIPSGVQAMSRDVPGVVETSTNMARVRTENNKLVVLNSTRSSVGSALNGVVSQISSIAQLADAKIMVEEGYPSWQPNMDSKMLAKAKEVWAKTHGDEAKFTVIHAGLECGIIGDRYPGMDMISLGPTIKNAHSPDEKVCISTVERFFTFTKAFLAALTSK